jgi:trehalose 6-phosphate phosphatase
MPASRVTVKRKDLDAVVFDMDGVVTRTATVHAAAWKRLFDAYLKDWATAGGRPFRPFDAVADYREYVDGKPRYDGVRDFLASRGIELPWGDPSDPPGATTVCGLGNRKNDYFNQVVAEQGVEPYGSTVELIRQLKDRGFGVAIITSSRNATTIMNAAGVADLFPVCVDGNVAERLGLPGKPDPAVFIEAAKELGATPARAAVVEDALVGVEAGRAGRFGLVIGVDRLGQAEALREHGADVVVKDLAEVTVAA